VSADQAAMAAAQAAVDAAAAAAQAAEEQRRQMEAALQNHGQAMSRLEGVTHQGMGG
jgi:hypothetical protein